MHRENIRRSVGQMISKAQRNRGLRSDYHPVFPRTGLAGFLRSNPEPEAQEDVELFGDIFPVAIFWFSIKVGTPAVAFPVAIDTGSYTLDIQDTGCDGCPTDAPNKQYNYKQSSTGNGVPCGVGCSGCDNGICSFSNTYETCDLSNPTAPCTIKGHKYTDMVSIDGAGPVNITFGAIDYQTSNFDQFKYICGVMGIAGPADNQNVFASLVKAGQFSTNVFAICLHEGSKSNGTMTLGGVNQDLAAGAFQPVPNIGYPDYTMTLKSITIGGSTVSGTTNTQAILDSGTNILLLPTPAYNSVATILKNNCTQNPLVGVCNTSSTIFDGSCFPLTQAQINQYPPIQVNLDGATLTMQGKDYVIPRDDPTQYCIGIAPTGSNGFLIIGDTTMQNYYVKFDNNAKTIEWAPVNTKTCGSI
eukprot:TRINITY_DN19630_c0_g1_i4.p1 TRINITY_DN19630_c0_g1~~TRINITY_DN19630_c0_g1_i4.p1  ORF type:complete len:415 (-),score=45.09 TRINITY_DN19630_c0_g1_i4:44-1288(-)